MPQIKQPLSLQLLALRGVGKFVTTIGHQLIYPICLVTRSNTSQGMDMLQHSLDRLNEILYASVPWYLFDIMAVEVLTAIAGLIQDTKKKVNELEMSVFINQMNIVVNLTEVALHPQLRQIDFSLWPKIMRHVLYKRLDRMTGLEVLNLGSGTCGWKTSSAEKTIIDGIKSMSNLTNLCLCYDCTDHILLVVGESCKQLKVLDITSSRSVTDRSINSLLNCKELIKLYLYRTSVSVEGYAQLLLGLQNLQEFGRCDDFGNILEHLSTMGKCGPFGLRVFESRDVTTNHLHLLINMCPKVTHISLYHDYHISDLTVLANLDELTELKLLNCDFFTDYVKQLLEIKGQNLTWLHLEHVDEIDLNALMYISQFCPNLKKLVFYNCDFLDHTSLSLRKLEVPPFQKLEYIQCVVECALLHLDFLLSNCINIKHIHLGSSTGIGDELMVQVLTKNHMKMLKELKILYSDNLSMRTVRLLMFHCKYLSVLSELESWQGITELELAEFRKELKINNIDLDISPTLSY